MRNSIIVLLALALVGCDHMTNDQIIAEVKKCTDADMAVRTVGFQPMISDVICHPKGEQK